MVSLVAIRCTQHSQGHRSTLGFLAQSPPCIHNELMYEKFSRFSKRHWNLLLQSYEMRSFWSWRLQGSCGELAMRIPQLCQSCVWLLRILATADFMLDPVWWHGQTLQTPPLKKLEGQPMAYFLHLGFTLYSVRVFRVLSFQLCFAFNIEQLLFSIENKTI